ncbi:unnamed protein product [Victoria cruziana]
MGCEKGEAALRQPSDRLPVVNPTGGGGGWNDDFLEERYTASDEFQVSTRDRKRGLNSPSGDCKDANQNRCNSETGATSPHSSKRVWKEMSLSNLVGEEETPGEEEQGEREMLLQDFLAKEGGRSSNVAPDFVGVYRPRPAMTACVSAPTTTLLSLNSMGCHEMHYLDWLGGFDPNGSASLHDLHHRHYLQQQVAEPQGLGPFCRKRGGAADSDETVDRRQKRMIKNRESAARSRARKQAYTNELEIEIAHLVEENIRLREQQQQQNRLRQVQQEQQMSGNNQGSGSRFAKEKPVLRRTSTAPF